MLNPKRINHHKPHRGHFKIKKKTILAFGDFGIISCQSRWLTSRHIESRRRVLTRYVRRSGKIWIRIFPDKTITARSEETRIGSGKGQISYWVAVICSGTIIFEIRSISIIIAKQSFRIAGSKLSIKTQFINKYDSNKNKFEGC